MSDLRRELRAVGIRGAQARRILAETSAHDCEALGDPRRLAEECAEALAPRIARRGACSSFAGLAIAGTVSLAAFALLGSARSFDGPQALALGTAIVAGQIAFVAGSLALLAALRRPGDVNVVARRALVGIAAGVVTLGSLAVVAGTYARIACAVSALALAGAAPFVARGLILRTSSTGHGDLSDDFSFAVDPRAVAIAAGALVWLAGIVQGDPIDGFIRGVFEGLACFGGFLVLGRYLSLRR